MRQLSNSVLITVLSLTTLVVVGCTAPVFTPSNVAATPPGWENTGSVNASFLTTGRNFASSSSSSSPEFVVGYIATGSNLDSLSWTFAGGTPASSTLIQQEVRYSGFGSFDVGLKVFNLEDSDTRYFEDYVRLFYMDDWTFSSDSWTASPTSLASAFQPKTDLDGNTIPSWIIIPETVVNEVSCSKSFTDFPSNQLILEFDYKLEKIPVLYAATTYAVSSTTTLISSGTTQTNTFTINTLNTPIEYVDRDVDPAPTEFVSPSTYPGKRRLVLEYNGFPIWVTSSMTDGVFKRIKLALPSLSDFELSFIRTENLLDSSGVIEYPYQAEIRNLTIKLQEEE
jgi:hypothetical protein